jgi:hypothetical protein
MYNRVRTASISVGIVMGILFSCLTGCSPPSPTANPTEITPTASAMPAQPQPGTEPVRVPKKTFTVIETLAPAETVIEVMKPTPIDPYIANLVQQAQQDLATRLNIPVEKIEFIDFEDMVWPDGSLGCPMPGMAYTQVMVEGYRILLQSAGQVYAYHGGGSRPPFLCQNPQK